MNRREFFKTASVAGAAGLTGGVAASSARGSERIEPWDELMGVLVDIPRCIGCRRCEFACQQAADFKNFEVPAQESFDDKSVFAEQRRPQPREHTVINRYANPADESRPLYNKVNCLHCIDPACLSACLVTAFSKRPDGPVVYDPWRCMGCRYCMVACPFEIPTYDYDMPLAPRVRKCNLCAHIVPGEQEVPACVKMCPEEVMTYGPRKELLALARERIRSAPDKYVDHIYGEHEAGGTSWLYLSSVPFEQVGMVNVPEQSMPRLVEGIQHGIFKFFVPPAAWAGLLGIAMYMTKPEKSQAGAEGKDHD